VKAVTLNEVYTYVGKIRPAGGLSSWLQTPKVKLVLIRPVTRRRKGGEAP